MINNKNIVLNERNNFIKSKVINFYGLNKTTNYRIKTLQITE